MRGNKYHNQPITVDGIRFASVKESRYYCQLRLLKKAGRIKEIKCQPRFKMPCGVTFVADFDVLWDDGRREIFEVKGMPLPSWKNKAKMFKHHYPDLKLTVV